MNRPQLVIIAGPTATGKTALAVALATRHGAEIVGADSRQVYRYLDIGTAKPTAAERASVPHHMIDVVEPDEHFDGACFRTSALLAIQGAFARGKRVFVVGGTGLYLRALTQGLFAGPPADPTLRQRLQQQEHEESAGFLHRWLQRVDPDAARRLHPHDSVRLIRALEVFLLTEKPISQWQREHAFSERPFATLTIGLTMDRAALARRIEQRCRDMVQAGLVDEVRHLWEMGYGPELSAMRTIGYAQIGDMLRGHYDTEEALTRMTLETRRLAKRQMTWLRADPEVQWFPPTQVQDIEEAIVKFWQRHDD